MRVKRLIKCLGFREQDRELVTLGPRTRLNPETNRAQLAFDPILTVYGGGFPTAATHPDLWVKTKLTYPRAVRRWIGFEAGVIHASDPDNPTQILTNVRFRLDNGTNEYYWNGSAWVVAAAHNWNTEQQLSDNIHLWNIRTLGQKMRVVVNLSTSDARYTPELIGVKLLYEAAIEFQEDIIFRSLVPALRKGLRPIGRTVFTAPATGTVFNLETLEIETPYNFVGVDSAFNYTSDPDLLDDLLLSYDPLSKNVTLKQSIAAGQMVFINFLYEPEVAVTTSQDFIESEKVPAVIITDLELVDTVELQQDDHVSNKGAATAVVVPAPMQGDLQGTLIAMSDKAVDNQRIWDEIKHFFANNPFLTSTGLDERYRLWLVNEYEDTTVPDQKELHSGEATFRIRNVRFWTKDAFDDFIATSKPKTGGSGNLVLRAED